MDPIINPKGVVPAAIYTARNCEAAYQLNWSVSVFGHKHLPTMESWAEGLRAATEADGVRVLECQLSQPNVAQFLVSTRPNLSPSEIVRSVKGRLQYLLQSQFPKAFRRNYFIGSVGEANAQTLEGYIDRQVDKHPMADSRVTQMLEALQFHDPAVDAASEQIGNYGLFHYALQVVLENHGGWNEVREPLLLASRNMVINCAAKKNWRLARIGLLSNHIHILLGCHVTESPESVAISLPNNLAFAQGMTAAFRFSYYVGTFGHYDRDAVRRQIT